jgi:formate hydrogenlyase transcriptional activator
MKPASSSVAQNLAKLDGAQNKSDFFSAESVLDIPKLILAGSELSEVLTVIARLVESRREGLFCTIWLPDEDGKYLYCAAAPSLPGFREQMGRTQVCAKGASCGTAVYRREPVYVADIFRESSWDDYRDRMLPFGIRAVWSRPLFTREGEVLGTFAILYREERHPDANDLQLIENASHVTAIAIERHMKEQALHRERDRLRLLLKITSSVTSKLDLRGLVEVLSKSLLSVTRSDSCALLLPDADSEELRLTILYNPESRGAICDGAKIPVRGAPCGKAFRTGKTQYFNNLEEVRDDPESYGSDVGRRFIKVTIAEGLVSGCDLPLIGRNGVVGVLAAIKRSKSAFSEDELRFLEQVAGPVAIAVENAISYEAAIKERDRETKQRRHLEEEIRSEFTQIVGESQALKAALSLVSVVAPTDSSVLILGETGTGKELFARAIHGLSARRDGALKQVGRRLGYTAAGVFVRILPDLCHAYKERRKAWSEDHRNRLGRSIREWLAAEAQPTVSSVCRTFGISAAYFQEHFPQEKAEVVQRSAERARKAREANTAALREQVFTVVRQLLQRNLYPSLPRVRAGLGPDITKYYPLLRPAINNALSRQGSVVRPRNELGQFV